MAAATLIHTIDKSLLYPPQPTYQLSSNDRIAHLESELYALRARNNKFVPLGRTRAQTARKAHVESSDDEESAREETPKKTTPPKEVIPLPTKQKNKAPAVDPVIDSVTSPAVATMRDPAPEHPFRNAKDAAYAPPVDRNLGKPEGHNNTAIDARFLYQIPGIAQMPDASSWSTAHHPKSWLLWVLFHFLVHLVGILGREKFFLGPG